MAIIKCSFFLAGYKVQASLFYSWCVKVGLSKPGNTNFHNTRKSWKGGAAAKAQAAESRLISADKTMFYFCCCQRWNIMHNLFLEHTEEENLTLQNDKKNEKKRKKVCDKKYDF